ncbi:DUF979 domain-containing protein [Erysipelothrix rhusiopathiae]|nr:DUF979 domain-containing protein [Erysipelothrix rhusiopathiae]MDE8172704.1 DUF979 domain-containing protein [Erysipelothrix rhusiopathiae]MDE8180713.1 DUF979 domain-containing protein [Erysipelothrix rhusiopathiae]MDE9421882.1 DUF979 domain-containing protein [Erysipelothrix rhusiopathiae]
MTANFGELFLEMWYMVVGCIFIATAVSAYRNIDDNRKYGAASFWIILAVLFMLGKYIPNKINGLLVLALGVLSFMKTVNIGDIEQISQDFRDEQSDRIGFKIFIPSVFIAIGAFLFSFVLPKVAPGVSAGVLGYIAIGLSAACGLIATFIITKTKPKGVMNDATRLMRTMGSFSILPQLLSALGVVFTTAGVGSLIATLLGSFIPNGNIFAGVVAYCVGMAIFTIIMGNAFAAFTVITIGIGIPFVFAQGANPLIAGALAMTAGFCGTLLTPMAANFNIVPAALLETKSQYSIIKYQAPMALIMLVIHIFLMYFLAF